MCPGLEQSPDPQPRPPASGKCSHSISCEWCVGVCGWVCGGVWVGVVGRFSILYTHTNQSHEVPSFL